MLDSIITTSLISKFYSSVSVWDWEWKLGIGPKGYLLFQELLLHSLHFCTHTYIHTTVVALGSMSLDSCGLLEGDYVRICKLQQPSQVPVAGEVWVEPW